MLLCFSRMMYLLKNAMPYLGAWDKWKGCIKELRERIRKGICSCCEYIGFCQYIALSWNRKETSCPFKYEFYFQFISTIPFFRDNGFYSIHFLLKKKFKKDTFFKILLLSHKPVYIKQMDWSKKLFQSEGQAQYQIFKTYKRLVNRRKVLANTPKRQ